MKNIFSTAIIAAAIALLVPNNGAEAVGTATAMMVPVTVVQTNLPASVSSESSPDFQSEPNQGTPQPSAAWLMALGFLGLVITRRMRGQ